MLGSSSGSRLAVMAAAVPRMSKPPGVPSYFDGSAKYCDTEATTGAPFVTVTVVFESGWLVARLVASNKVVSTKVNVVFAKNVFGVKTSASSSLVIAAAAPGGGYTPAALSVSPLEL